MNKPEPTRLKLNPETPVNKNVNKIPMQPLNKEDIYVISIIDDVYISDNDSIYVPVKKKD